MASKKDIERYDKDSELWDSKQLGASSKHAIPASPEMEKAIDDALGLQLLSFRIQQSIVGQLKELAKLEGIGYQPLMRRILTNWVRDNEHKLEHAVSPPEAVRRADELFAHAIKLGGELSKLKPLSSERIAAEGVYHNALTESHAIFRNVYKTCTDPVLNQHIELRLSQFKEVLKKKEAHKKYGNKRAAG